MLAEQEALRHTLADMRAGLSGILRIGAIPTALTVASLLTTPLYQRHPMVRFSLESMSSRDIVARLDSFDIDVGMTYVDGEPLGKVRVLPLYRERYLFLTPRADEFTGRTSVGWAEATSVPLCLLTPAMQNRRILDGHFAAAGVEATPVVETDTVSAIYEHVASMELSSIIPHAWLHGYEVPEGTRILTLPPPKRAFHVGLVLPTGGRETMLARSLVDTAAEVDVGSELELAVAARRLNS
ncbi:LysR family transcriptional regulator substrate-binding protein [Nocardia sp. CA-135398]|uniref:LysR family transcriptional regulator substrate-binding protein n=1 Tax=Nocardia sp. CA-135398 TaxID=3239977 RepID=UPI003D9548F9